MRAAVLHEIGKPLKIEEVPVPIVGSEEILISVKACGICHTDLNYMDGLKPTGKLPIILGHEPAGVVSKIGNDAKQFHEGDRVIVYPAITCGMCLFCSASQENLCREVRFIGVHVDGAFAEYLKVPERSLIRLPGEIPFEEGALITDAVGTPYHALKDIARLKIGEEVVIYGTGGLGMNAVQIGRQMGAHVIAIDVDEEKLKLARKFGAEETVNAKEEDPPRRVKELTQGEGTDVAVQTTWAPNVTEQAIESVRKGGRVVVIGWGASKIVEINPFTSLLREIKIAGCSGCRRQNLIELVALARNRRLDLKSMISHKMQLNDINSGITMLRHGGPLRIVVKPQ